MSGRRLNDAIQAQVLRDVASDIDRAIEALNRTGALQSSTVRTRQTLTLDANSLRNLADKIDPPKHEHACQHQVAPHGAIWAEPCVCSCGATRGGEGGTAEWTFLKTGAPCPPSTSASR